MVIIFLACLSLLLLSYLKPFSVMVGNVALGAKVTTSSRLTAFQQPLPTDFTDGNLLTCGRTYVEHDPWVMLNLNNSYVLEDIVFRQDHADSESCYNMLISIPKMRFIV